MVRKEGIHTVRWGKASGAVPLAGTLDSIVKNAASLPGPGQYQLDKDRRVTCTKFGSHAGKTYLEEVVYLKRDVPGPNSYPINNSSLQPGGGRFSTATVPTFADNIARQSIGPGPGKYIPPILAQPKGGKWGPKESKSAPSFLDTVAARASTIPAPGQYGIIPLPAQGGGRFGPPPQEGKERQKLWRIPGPQHYGLLPVNGGARPWDIRIGGARAKTEVDLLCDAAKLVPGPGAYDVNAGYEKSTFSHKERKEVFDWEEQPFTQSPIRKEELLVGGGVDTAVDLLTKRYKEAQASSGPGRGRAKAVYSSTHSTKHMLGDFSECTDPIPKMRFSY